MKTIFRHPQFAVLSVIALLLFSMALQAQEERSVRPERNTFESIWLIDNQTVMVPIKGTLEMDIQHRFGTMDQGYEDLWGIYAPSNIRIGFNYVPIDRLQVGFGFTKMRNTWDFNGKYALIQQGRGGGSPVSITYFLNGAVDTRPIRDFVSEGVEYETIDRFSYFHQLMVARKFTRSISLQASLSLSHFNFVPIRMVNENALKRDNDHLGLALLGRAKISSSTAFIVNLDYALTDHEIDNPYNNMSFGLEFTTSSHAFQIFIGNFYNLVPQYNNALNQNEPPNLGDLFNFNDGEPTNMLIGFNMTRLWNF